MRVGIITKWYSSGQAVVSRQVRSALDELGHETFILARQGTGPRTQEATGDDVWEQPGVTEVEDSDVALADYEAWVDANGIEAVLTDNLYQFEEMAALRRRGVKTIGRFVWEHYTAEHVAPTKEAFDLVYAMHRGEQERYREMGLESTYVTWGCHPELLAFANGDREPDGLVRFYIPGSFLGKRKPLDEMLEAFRLIEDTRLRLLIKGQVEKRVEKLQKAAKRDKRLTVVLEDQATDEHFRMVAACDVCLTPTRWEGLGLPLFEALAFGQPTITNDNAPMNEVVRDDVNGILVGAEADGTARSGIPAWTPDVDDLASAIQRLADDDERERLAAGARQLRDGERAWSATVESYRGLLGEVS